MALRNQDVKRVRGPIKEFRVTTKQFNVSLKLSKISEEDWRGPSFDRIAKEEGFSQRSLPVLRKKWDKLFELATYIRNEIPYKIISLDSQIREEVNLWNMGREMFCQEVAADPFRNLPLAAERAGYTNVAYGYQLIREPKVIARIKEIQEERRIKFMPNIDNLLSGLVIESNSNIVDYVKRFDGDDVEFRDSKTIPRDQMSCIKSIKKTIKGSGKDQSTSIQLELKDSLKAKALLFKYFGLDIEGTNTDPKAFVQDVVEFSQKISQVSAFPMETIPGGIIPDESDMEEQDRQDGIESVKREQERFQNRFAVPEPLTGQDEFDEMAEQAEI